MKLGALARGLLPDLFLLGGAAAITVGLWWFEPWVSLVGGGLLAIAGGILLERANRIREERAQSERRRR